MSAKKKTPVSNSSGQPALKIGSRVRCTDDGVGGRIVWCNALSVKVRWDDGEQVTWRRDSLAERPIEILAATDDGDQDGSPAASSVPEPTEESELPQAEPEPANTLPETIGGELASSELEPPAVGPAAPAAETTTAEGAPGREPKRRKAPEESREKRLSALDAAAKVLEESGQPMTCKEMIVTMAAKGYWTSPKGRTPEATLYSALQREIVAKGKDARFRKTERGKFARNGAA